MMEAEVKAESVEFLDRLLARVAERLRSGELTNAEAIDSAVRVGLSLEAIRLVGILTHEEAAERRKQILDAVAHYWRKKDTRFDGLDEGIYIITWKEGGTSFAAVGRDRSGRMWYAPTNWTEVPCFDWSKVESVRTAPACDCLGGCEKCLP